MDIDRRTEFQQLFQMARDGCVESQGQLLDQYRKLLKMLVRAQVFGAVRIKMDASDIVQETLMHAFKTFSKFRGATERELIGWLRSILALRLAQSVRWLHAQRRSIKLERQFAEDLERSSIALDRAFVQSGPSPSEIVSRRERIVLIADAIEDLPEDYRTVILLRHIQGLSYPEIAAAMDRSVFSVQKLWVRALATLKREIERHV